MIGHRWILRDLTGGGTRGWGGRARALRKCGETRHHGGSCAKNGERSFVCSAGLTGVAVVVVGIRIVEEYAEG